MDELVDPVREVLEDVLPKKRMKLVTKEIINEELMQLRARKINEDISDYSYEFFPSKIIDLAVKNIREKMFKIEIEEPGKSSTVVPNPDFDDVIVIDDAFL